MNLHEIMELDQQYYMNTFGARTPVAFEKGQGMTLTALDGRVYTDYLGGIAVNALGYGHPALTQAVVEQARKLMHCSNLYYIEKQAELARLLVEQIGGPCGLTKVFFGNSGAEANEGALKLARAYFYKQGIQRYEVISAKNSFHGRTLATVAATGQSKYQAPYYPLTPGFINVEYNSMPAIINALTGHTAAILLEVIQGEGGVIEADPEYLAQVSALCKDKGLLLIVDEVQTGMGRTGKPLAIQHYDLKPHIVTLAKALGGGIPIGAVMAREEVAQAFAPGDHGSTFGGNPLACAAGVAVVTEIMKPGFLDNVRTMGAALKRGLESLKARHGCILDVRGKGLLLGLELDAATDGKAIVQRMFEHRLLINCAAHNTLRFAPPLIIGEKEIQLLTDTLDMVLP